MSVTLQEKVRHEAKSFAIIFLYVFAILVLFTLHKNFLLGKNPFSDQLLNLINAFVLGKVILVLEMFKVGDRSLQVHRAIWRILAKSVIFGLLLLAFRILEEALKGWFRGQTFSQSLAELGARNLVDIGMLVVLIMVALTPYFFIREIVNALGYAKLKAILWTRPAREGQPPA
ncbi:MAG TPA: hypothetical protein VHY09_13400 [Candidatus Methylacidiphilales bacterium]|jgi:hypothetical protein|nr:hypothetical protein [Candidatus Methylacidiphilales bacterium]